MLKKLILVSALFLGSVSAIMAQPSSQPAPQAQAPQAPQQPPQDDPKVTVCKQMLGGAQSDLMNLYAQLVTLNGEVDKLKKETAAKTEEIEKLKKLK